MRRRAATGGMLACLALLVAPAPDARALSCAVAPKGAQSTQALAVSGDFHGRFDGAIVGVVHNVRTAAASEPLADVDVEQSFGPRLDGRVRIIGSHWYPLDEGHRYLIPYVLDRGERRSLLCWDAPEPLAAPLPIPTSSVRTPAPAIAAQPASDHDSLWPGPLAAVLVAAATAALIAVPLLRRHIRG